MDIDREKVKEAYRLMSRKEKIQYIFENYRLHMLIGVIAIIGIVMIIGRFTFNKPIPACLQIGIRAAVINPEAVDELPAHLAERFSEMTEDGKKEFQIMQLYAGYSSLESEEAGTIMDKMAASVAAGMLDVLVGDSETLVQAANLRILKDLRDVFTEEELAEINTLASARSKDGESGIITAGYEVTGSNGLREERIKDIPYLICITGTDDGIDEALAMQPCYLAIIVNSPNIDNVKAFIWELLGENAN